MPVDEQGRFRIFADQPCPIKTNSATAEDEIDALLPSDDELMRKLGGNPRAHAQPQPRPKPTPRDMFQQVAHEAFLEFRIDDLSEQMSRLSSGADKAEESEAETLGVPSEKEILRMMKQ